MKKENAITLISLVVTIIILLILAGISIMSLTGSGLFNKTNRAKEEHLIAQAKEHINLKISEVQIEKQGSATLIDVAEHLKNDKNAEYLISLTKTSSLIGSMPDLTNATEMYVTYNNVELKIDSTLNVEYVGTKNSSNGSTDSSGGNTGSGSVQLGECSRYIEVKAYGTQGNLILSVDVPEADDQIVKSINYYINGNLIHSGKDKEYKVTDLQTDTNYDIYAIVEYEDKKIITSATSSSIPDADIYVATTGDNTTGNGTVDKPYATLAKAINMASNGNKIYIFPGEYNLSSIYHQVSMVRRCIFRNF